MILRTIRVRDKGEIENEHVLFKARRSGNLSSYMILDTTYDENGEISDIFQHNYWFPDTRVKQGDFIRLYTKEGKNSYYINKSGSKTYSFYWGSKKPIWNQESDAVIIMEIGDFSIDEV